MKTLIVTATRQNDHKNTILSESLSPLLDKGVKFSASYTVNNTQGLPLVYNKALTDYARDYDCIVFVHDDVYIDDAFVLDKIEDGFGSGFDIVGVAGGTTPVIKAPALWHIMCGRGNLRGAAGHFSADMKTVGITSFGPMPARVALLDGLFLAVNTKRVLETGWKFNENYDFHLYDLSSCLDANAKGLRMGVLPIHLTHKSPGLSDINDACFQRNQAKFLQEYSK